MAQIVHHDVIARTDEGGNRAVSGRPSGRIERDVLHPEQGAEVLLQLQRQPRVAEQDRRAGAMRAELAHGLDARFGNAWMAAHSALICIHTSLNAKNADTRALNARVAKWSFRGQLQKVAAVQRMNFLNSF